MNSRIAVAAVLACAAIVSAPWIRADSTGLPAGQHSAVPKLWSEGGWRVTNYTPFEFDRRIDSLTPGTDHDLWFSVGASLEHIDAHQNLTSTRMPHDEWIVAGIAIGAGHTWFSAGQSGKVGIVDTGGNVHYIQVVPRRNFPDLRDLLVNPAGEMWFLDPGRLSIGYRSSSGRVVENPFTDGSNPWRMTHCMGKLWVMTYGKSGTALHVIDESLRPQRFFIDSPVHSAISDIACDANDRLWLSLTDYRNGGWVERFDAGGHFKTIPLVSYSIERIAADRTGGMWLAGQFNRQYRTTLLHVDRQSTVTTHTLPTITFGQSAIAFDADRRLWLAMNDGGSPVAVTELEP